MSTSVAEAFPAGEILGDELEARGWTQGEFAQILGRPTQFVSEIIAGKKEITRESAAQIGAALGTTPEMWLNLQDQYYLWRQSRDASSQRQLDDVRLRARLNDFGPIAVMRERGLLKGNTPQQLEREVCALYKIETLDDSPAIRVAARRAAANEDVSATQLAWAACVRRAAESLEAKPFDADGLRDLAERMTQEVATPEKFLEIPAALASVGVRLVYIEAFPGSKMDGCSLLLEDGSVAIGLSGRGKRFDKVLFTLLHEIAHVLLGHLNKTALVIDDQGSSATLGLEGPADDQAQSWVLPGDLPHLPERITQGWIDEVAQAQGIHPIVLVGRLQKVGRIPWKSTLVKDAPSVTKHLERWRPAPGEA